MKLGLMAFANDSGLGAQTRRLTYMLKPDRILVIDSSGFSKNKVQHFDWYSGFDGYKVQGFPTNGEIRRFMMGITHMIVCENPLNFYLLEYCKDNGVKLYIQSNFEFCDHLNNDLPLPTKFLMPSHWKVEEMIAKFGADRVEYLPPPIDPNEFKDARKINFDRGDLYKTSPRFLHIVGTLAERDRNGTLDLLRALRFSTAQFDLVIRSQHELPNEYYIQDRRVKYDVRNHHDAQEMYKDFDAMIQPRRYGGLSLTTNEGLMSGLPVIMSDVSPNNQLLPAQWVVKARKREEFMTRAMIGVYETDAKALGEKIDWLTTQNLDRMKGEAFGIGYDNFSVSALEGKYKALWSQ